MTSDEGRMTGMLRFVIRPSSLAFVLLLDHQLRPNTGVAGLPCVEDRSVHAIQGVGVRHEQRNEAVNITARRRVAERRVVTKRPLHELRDVEVVGGAGVLVI